MKNIKLIYPAILLLIAANTAFAQTRVGGRVIEILDGRTVVIQTLGDDRLTAQLQYIEVPETTQTFHKIAEEHLKTLVLDKKIEFRARGLSQTKTVGQLLLNGVDVSRQMIRDGAAWYAVLEKNAQDYNESKLYQANEAQAKSEKLGIWSVAGLKPSWEVRAEAEADRRRQEEKIAQERAAADEAAAKATAAAPKPKPVVRRQLNSESQMWTETAAPFGKVPENVSTVGGLLVSYDPLAKIGLAATPLLKIDVADKDGSQAVGIGIAYLYHDDENKGRETVYFVGVESESRDFKFLKFNDLTVTADNQKILIGKARRRERQTDFSVQEILIYQIKRSVFTKIANAKKVEVKVGNYAGRVPENIQSMLANLLKVSE